MIGIVGGGISGLVLAYELVVLGADVTLWESEDRPGGVLWSERKEDLVLELGPQRARLSPGFRSLVADLGLTDELVTADTGLPLFVYCRGRLRQAPLSLRQAFATDLLPWSSKIRVLAEPFSAGLRHDETVGLVEAVVQRVTVPVSVKMRLGWDHRQLTAPWFARAFEQIGVSAVAIHGRTREQGFGGTIDLDGIRQVVEAVESIPVIGNGDVRSVADASRMLEVTGCHGVSIGRGALANPWIFRQLVQWEQTGHFDPPGNFDDRLRLLLRQFQYLVDQKGPERAIVSFRRMAHWYLKSMRVRAALRHRFQQVGTLEDFNEALAEIRAEGPATGSRSGVLPDMQVPVPSGPISHW